MISEDFLNSKYSYCVNVGDMNSFLNDCDDEGLKWYHGGHKASEFNPFYFYEGDKIEYLAPVMNIDDRNRVYIRCLYGKLTFSFHKDWSNCPSFDYKAFKNI